MGKKKERQDLYIEEVSKIQLLVGGEVTNRLGRDHVAPVA